MYKNLFFKGIIILFLFCILLYYSPVSIVSAKLAEPSKEYIKDTLADYTSQDLYIFYNVDVDFDGVDEVVALTASKQDYYTGLYTDGSVWLIDDGQCEELYNTDLALYKLEYYNVTNGVIVATEEGAGGSGSESVLWVYTRNSCDMIRGIGLGFYEISKNNFIVRDSRFDATRSGIGHTYNAYYLQWNNNKLIECAGKKISYKKLKKYKNGKKIYKQIKKKGKIKSIYLRSNGIININFQTKTNNYNVTLTVKKGKVSYRKMVDYGKTALERATCDGLYRGHLTKLKLVYPS